MSSVAPLLGILQLDRGEPLGFANLGGLAQAWVQDAGGFAFVGLIVYLLYARSAAGSGSQSERLRLPLTTLMILCAGIALVCYTAVGMILAYYARTGSGTATLGGTTFALAPVYIPTATPWADPRHQPPALRTDAWSLFLTLGGLFALLGIGQPFARDMLKLKWRRVGALAKLAFKEAVRSRLLWALAPLALPFLFPLNWFVQVKAEDELRTTVWWVSMALTVVVLLPAAIVGAFSIPNDIKNQNIHTVVTKPVERVEIVLGRFLGYAALMTLVLAGATAVSLLLIESGSVNEKAAAETKKARVPVRGGMTMASRKEGFSGVNVGREFEYRKYITGHPRSSERGIWSFPSIPSSLASADGDRVPLEFTFDIFRTHKGEENRGVDVTFRLATWKCPQVPPQQGQGGEWQWADPRRKAEYDADVKRLFPGGFPGIARPGTADWKAANELAEKYGFFEIRGKEVFDYHVMGVDVPAGLFRNARDGDPPAEPDGSAPARMKVYVQCLSPGQMLGMAGPDLYLLEANRTFAENYVKGMVGLWCRLLLVLGLAVACGTYLTGVVALLATGFLFISGYFTDHIADLAANRSAGGGPFESLTKLVRTDVPTAQLGDKAADRLALTLDKGMAWVIRRFQNLVPDVESYSWTAFVQEGYNIRAEYLAVNILVTAAYLLPWLILAYYLIKSREVAA